MDEPFGKGKMDSTVRDGVLTITRRTYRSGDFVHILFSAFATLFGLTFLWIAIENDTLFDGASTLIVILVLLVYGYFGLTRIVNRRIVQIANGRITARDGPLPQLVRFVDADLAEYGKVRTRSAMRFTFPPTSKYRLYYVGGEVGPDLFRRLREEDEAKYAVARIRSFLAGSD